MSKAVTAKPGSNRTYKLLKHEVDLIVAIRHQANQLVSLHLSHILENRLGVQLSENLNFNLTGDEVEIFEVEDAQQQGDEE